MKTPVQFYTQQKEMYATQLAAIKRRSLYVSAARLIAFLFVAICIYFVFQTRHILPLVFLSLAGAVLFLVLVRASVSLMEKKRLVQQLLFINNNELNIISGSPNSFDPGSNSRSTQMYAGDLDVFGQGSLYHLLNRTTTDQGKRCLASQLDRPLITRQHILLHQDAIRQFAIQPELRQSIMAHGLVQEEGDDDIRDIAGWIEAPDRLLGNTLINVLRYLLPVIAIAGLFLYLDNNNPLLLGIGVIGNWIMLGYFGKYTMAQHTLIGKKEAVLKQHGTILHLFGASDSGSSALLEQLKLTSFKGYAAILRLSKLSSFFDQRLNLLVGFVFNSFIQYDTHVVIALEKWKKRNRGQFLQWIETVGEIEKLNSFANFHFNHPAYPFPLVREAAPFIHATQLGHPLIPQDRQVSNDFTAGPDEKLLLITGSNMSGKSTFLRTVGLNLLLAECGLPVCATSFSFAPMHILTSINITDSLAENTSYFMAELKRLKEIITRLQSGEPALVLIDEVLRGTNSDDKTFGSEELIRMLTACNCLSLFASHDLNLSVLENALGGRVKNYCFESTIVDGELLFDYQLQRGVAKNKNASFLMKKMGIIP